MPNGKARPHGRGKQTALGISEREEKFAQERRKDPTAAGWVIAQRAGFLGDAGVLTRRAGAVMKKPQVLAIIHAPAPRDAAEDESGELDPVKLKDELRRKLLFIVRGSAGDADKIRAIDKLLCTIEGAYVPVGLDVKGKLTMEAIVRAMGGAPDEELDRTPALPSGAQA